MTVSPCLCSSSPYPVPILSLYPCTLVLYSAGPGFHWISAWPGEQMLESRNKWHRSKWLLVSWLVLSYLLVKQWHLKIGSWVKHPVWMLDDVHLWFFSKQFFLKENFCCSIWALRSCQPCANVEGHMGLAMWLQTLQEDPSLPVALQWKSNAKCKRFSPTLAFMLMDIVTLEELPFGSSWLLAQARRCKYFLICIHMRARAESYREG